MSAPEMSSDYLSEAQIPVQDVWKNKSHFFEEPVCFILFPVSFCFPAGTLS